MKLIKRIILSALAIGFVMTLSGCKKELQGTLHIRASHYGGGVYIYAVENTSTYIMDIYTPKDKSRDVNLLAGNYLLQSYNADGSSDNSRSGFQIMPGKTTEVWFDGAITKFKYE